MAIHTIKTASFLLILTLLSGCGVNSIPSLDEQVNATWAQVENQYQRRADLVPNLVAVVKGYTTHETETLQAVTNARAKVASIQINGDLQNNPTTLQKFEKAQSQLTAALNHLMRSVERYPDLKANQNFLALQSQLEGTENRIAISRRDYILAVNQYNTEIRTFPGRIWHRLLYSDMPLRSTYKATSESVEQAPRIDLE